jgi:hypothetical protein
MKIFVLIDSSCFQVVVNVYWIFKRYLDVVFVEMQWFLESTKYGSRFVLIFSRLLMYVIGS